MEITHWTHGRHQMAKTIYILQTARKDITGKTSKMLVWDSNGPLRPPRDRIKRRQRAIIFGSLQIHDSELFNIPMLYKERCYKRIRKLWIYWNSKGFSHDITVADVNW
jgi:hypothetical protein